MFKSEKSEKDINPASKMDFKNQHQQDEGTKTTSNTGLVRSKHVTHDRDELTKCHLDDFPAVESAPHLQGAIL